MTPFAIAWRVVLSTILITLPLLAVYVMVWEPRFFQRRRDDRDENDQR